MTIEDLVGERLMIGLKGATLTDDDVRVFRDTRAAGLILYRRNFDGPAALATLLDSLESALGRRLLVATDHEGGRIVMLGTGTTIFPDNLAMGTAGEEAFALRQGEIEGRELRRLGVDVSFGPCLDVLTERYSPNIGIRSYGKDPELVGRLGAARIRGMQEAGLSACAKHFPGHGDTSTDSHFHLPRLPHDLDRLRRVELPPFQAAVRENVAAVMCAHALFDAIDPQRPATMSDKVIQDLLRRQLGFNGAVFSDDLEMKAIVDHFGVEQAVVCGAEAGIDLFFVCRIHELQQRAIDALARGIRDGVLSPRHIAASHARLDDLFNRFVRPPSKWTRKSIELLGAAMP